MQPKKAARKILLKLRGKVYSGKLDNIYLATVQKSGSQWVNSVFSDMDMQRITKLKVYPQHNYEFDEFENRFPRGTVVPGLYLDHPTFDVFIDKPRNYKVVYVVRDPRDIVVSWYHSMYSTHGERKGVDIVRKKLRTMSKEEGIAYCIQYLAPKFSALRSWVELAQGDKKVLFIKFEDLIKSPVSKFAEILEFCDIEYKEENLIAILNRYTKNKLREKDLQGRDGNESHYRKSSSSYLVEFSEAHLKAFYGVTGNLVELLEYDV